MTDVLFSGLGFVQQAKFLVLDVSSLNLLSNHRLLVAIMFVEYVVNCFSYAAPRNVLMGMTGVLFSGLGFVQQAKFLVLGVSSLNLLSNHRLIVPDGRYLPVVNWFSYAAPRNVLMGMTGVLFSGLGFVQQAKFLVLGVSSLNLLSNHRVYAKVLPDRHVVNCFQFFKFIE